MILKGNSIFGRLVAGSPVKSVDMNAAQLKHTFYLLFHLFISGHSLSAQSDTSLHSISFTKFTSVNGYPQGIVTDLHQDSLGFIWIATADGLFRFDGYDFKEYRTALEDENTIRGNTVTQVITDKADNLWISVQGNGLSQLDRKTGQFKHYYASEQATHSIPDNSIWQLCLGPDGHIWAGTRSNGLFRLNPETDDIDHFLPLIDESNSLWSKRINCIYKALDGTLWVGTDQGVNIIQAQAENIQRLTATKTLSNPSVRSIYEAPNGQVWVGTADGLNLWNPKTEIFERVGESGLSHQGINSISIGPDQRLWVGTDKGLNAIDLESNNIEVFQKGVASESIYSVDRVGQLLLDQQNLLWVGTWRGALSRVEYRKKMFGYWGADSTDSQALSSGNIKSIFQTQDQVLWVGTNFDGLNRIDRKTGVNRVFNTENGLSHNTVYSIWADAEGAWIGTSNGLNYYHEATGRFYHYYTHNSPLPNNLIWSLKKDKSGHLWIGTSDGLAVLKTYEIGRDLDLELFFHDPNNQSSLSMSSIRSLYVDAANDVWIGTSEGGLNHYNRKKATFERYKYAPDAPDGIPEDYVFFIHEDHNRNIWVGTSKGASRLDRETQKFTHLTEKDGLPNNYVFSIFEDEEHALWMSTNRGLFWYDPQTEKFKTYEKTDGLQDNEFNQGAAHQDLNTGALFFGGINGLNEVRPKLIELNEFVPPVVFTGLEYYNNKSKGSPIRIEHFIGQSPVELSYRENIIRIEFAALNFIQSNKNQYQYQLKGFSNQWFDLKNNHEVVFTNLDYKKYKLNVKASNNDGIWCEQPASLDLIIKPPIMLTTAAYILYGLFFILSLVVIYRFILSRRLSLAKNRQLQAIDELKTKFFTNIAHDFKSPLTVILSAVRNLPAHSRTRILVERSSKSLLDLINQMLELRKLESNKLPLRFIHGDVVECIRYTYENFQKIGEEQEVKLHFISSEAQMIMDYDEEKLTRILSNLISNAIKYNQAQGNVYLLLDQLNEVGQPPYLSIRVMDTGIGIGEKDLDQIFNRFYQIKPTEAEGTKAGSGVGLALTQELVQLLGGSIQVKSKLGQGSEFTVLLPIKNQAVTAAVTHVPRSPITEPSFLSDEVLSSSPPLEGVEKNRLLLIEDHQDIAEVLIQLLQSYYQVQWAKDGAEGIELAQTEIPDLIISDVMMPKKDGYEVLSTLKNDEKTLHIPIVLLTAKSGVDSRIVGLQKGADAYIGKPFSNTELLVQVENLLDNRTKLQHYYRASLIQDTPVTEAIIEEDPFVARARKILLENLADESFRIPELTRAMGVSRTQLHNKLKGITGKSASHFMNAIRLRKGRELLLASDLTIAEIAYSVGFKDPNYFSGLYKELFKETPSRTRK